MSKVTCPVCNGDKLLKEMIPSPTWGRDEVEYELNDCYRCKGTGEVEEV